MNVNDRDFMRLVLFVRNNYGINLERKRQLIEARLSFYITKCGYSSFTAYINDVLRQPDGEMCQTMINKLSTNYTFFFRETDYIQSLCDSVLLQFALEGRKHLKIWCAACSSGQEAYSVAMVLEFQKKLMHGAFDYEIIGTDINTETLGFAADGVYQKEEADAIPERYCPFLNFKSSGTFEISDTLKKKITWKYANLLNITNAGDKYDIIFCRNVMIYFTPQQRRETTEKLYASMLPGGYLYTGSTESVDLERRFFNYVAPSIYRKN